MRQKLAFISFCVVCALVWVVGGYFILVNTVWHDTPLAAVLSLASNQPVEFSADQTGKITPASITVNLDGNVKQLTAISLDMYVDPESVTEFGKGPDLGKVLSEGWQALAGEVIMPTIKLDARKLLAEYGVHQYDAVEDRIFVAFDGEGYLQHCPAKTFKFTIQPNYEATINQQIADKRGLALTLSQLIVEPEAIQLINLCNKYITEISLLQQNLPVRENGWANSLTLNRVGEWVLADATEFNANLNNYQQRIEQAIEPAEYIDLGGGKIGILKAGKAGQRLDFDTTRSQILDWLNSQPATRPDQNLAVVVPMPVELPAGEHYDFTQVFAAGKTRIDIIRNGVENWVLFNAQYGVEAVHNVIVEAGKEFSYIDTIKPQPRGWMANGKPIGGGICNATTTVFRAALEAGFPITERHAHGFYVPSYEWGYPMNMVDAAYYTNPRVDLKFINDLNAPILLQTEIHRENDGWQYHTIYIRTAANVPKREVVLGDWTKTNVSSARRYTGRFNRTVKQDGKEIRKDSFVSVYRR